MKQSSAGSPGARSLLRSSARPGGPFCRVGRAPISPMPRPAPSGALFPGYDIISRGKPIHARCLRTQAAHLLCFLHLNPGLLRSLQLFHFGYPRRRELTSAFFLRWASPTPRLGWRYPRPPTAACLALTHRKSSPPHWSWDSQFWLPCLFGGGGTVEVAGNVPRLVTASCEPGTEILRGRQLPPCPGRSRTDQSSATESHLSYLSETPFRLRSEREGKGRENHCSSFFNLIYQATRSGHLYA